MSVNVFIESIEWNDGQTLTFEKNDIVVFVGPNNVGKSATLREIKQKVSYSTAKTDITKEVIMRKSGSIEELHDYVSSFAYQRYADGTKYYSGVGYNLTVSSLDHYWQNTNMLSEMSGIFLNLLTTENRLAASNPPENISILNEGARNPIHLFLFDDELEGKFSEYFRQAFGMDLILNRGNGGTLPLHVGDRPLVNPGEDRISTSYLKRLAALPLLHAQGDGIKCFAGILFHAFISQYSILLIDEPEAFLHPPQARVLGKMLGKDLPKNKQLFLSTHSEDFLKGLLDTGNPNIKVIRINREQNINHVRLLDKADIQGVWGDSLLRHSNILDGLFHKKVIVCESDSDCRFYSAVMDSLYSGNSNISPDILFVHCGGKSRLSTVVNALMKVDVPISVIADFDVLNDVQPLRGIVESLGGEWDEIKNDFNIVKNAINQKRPELATEDVKEEINVLFNGVTERNLPKDLISKIQNVLKKASPWSEAKANGKSFVPSGDATQAYIRMESYFKSVNLFVVEVGELECFCKSIGGHGPKWVNEVLQKDLKEDPELETAREFIKKVIA